MFHQAADGLRLSSGPHVTVGNSDGTQTAQVSTTSLSPFTVAGWSCTAVSGAVRASVPMCNNVDDTLVSRWYDVTRPTQVGQHLLADAPDLCSDHGASHADPEAPAVGSKPQYIDCVTAANGGSATYTFRNASKDDLLLWRVGAVYRYTHGGDATTATTVPGDSSWLVRAVTQATKNTYLIPDASLTLTKAKDTPTTRLHFTGDAEATSAWYALPDIAAVVDTELQSFLPSLTPVLDRVDSCSASQTTFRAALVSCIKDNLKNALDSVLDGTSLEPPTGKLAKFKNAAGVASMLLAVMDAATYMGSLEKAAAPNFPGPDADVDLRYHTPIDPPSNRAGNDYIARDPATQRAVLVENGDVHAIPDGATFNCLAQTRLVWDIPALVDLDRQPFVTPTSCHPSSNPAWTYTPTAQGGNTGTDVILRDTTTPGHAWLINSAGEIQTIPDGGTYLCLAHTNPVIWNTPDNKINSWTPVGTEPASCGPTLDSLPRVQPTSFRFVRRDVGGSEMWMPIIAADNGWWLFTKQQPGGLQYTYQWIGPDGRTGPQWTSNLAPLSATTSPNGQVYLAGQPSGNEDTYLLRVGPNGFEQRIRRHFTSWCCSVAADIVLGKDGNLYWNIDSHERVILQVDPATLTVTAGVRKASSQVRITATDAGIVGVSYSSEAVTIPYPDFAAKNGQMFWLDRPSLITSSDILRTSVGEDGAVADLDTDSSTPVEEVESSYRNSNGESWVARVPALIGATFPGGEALARVTDIDALPSGGVVYTAWGEAQGLYLVWVSPHGLRQHVAKVADRSWDYSGRGPASQVDSTGLVVTTFTASTKCELLEQLTNPECGRVVSDGKDARVEVTGYRNGTRVFDETLRENTQISSFQGFSELGPGQVGVAVRIPDPIIGADGYIHRTFAAEVTPTTRPFEF